MEPNTRSRNTNFGLEVLAVDLRHPLTGVRSRYPDPDKTVAVYDVAPPARTARLRVSI